MASKAYPMAVWQYERIMGGQQATRQDAEFVARRLQADGITAIVLDRPAVDSFSGQPVTKSYLAMFLTSDAQVIARHIAEQTAHGMTNPAVFAA